MESRSPSSCEIICTRTKLSSWGTTLHASKNYISNQIRSVLHYGLGAVGEAGKQEKSSRTLSTCALQSPVWTPIGTKCAEISWAKLIRHCDRIAWALRLDNDSQTLGGKP